MYAQLRLILHYKTTGIDGKFHMCIDVFSLRRLQLRASDKVNVVIQLDSWNSTEFVF